MAPSFSALPYVMTLGVGTARQRRACRDSRAPRDARRYKESGVSGYHRNCEDNMLVALAELGKDTLVTPQPINFFTNTRSMMDTN